MARVDVVCCGFSCRQDLFESLSARKGDISIKVRLQVATFLQEVAVMCRPKAPLLPEAQYPRLVGAHINKNVGTVLHVGRVTGFDPKSCSFELEYGLPGSTSSSQNEIEEVSWDVLKNILVLMPGNALSVPKKAVHESDIARWCVRSAFFCLSFYETSSIEIL